MYKNCIRVYCRLKPNFNETPESCFNYEIVPTKENREGLLIHTRSTENFINNKPDMYSFQFSKVFNETCSQEEVYNEVAKPVIESVLQGYNGTIFAYGQTGSGKTFTISGNFYDDESQAIVHHSLRAIFKKIERISEECKVDISFLEIYNESGRDLFNQDIDTRIILQEDEDGEIQLRNLSVHNVRNYDEFISMYRSGESIRSESITMLNQFSSRSHCILTVYLTVKMKNSSKISKSKLHLIDLAGSERISKTQQNSQTTVVEARHINLSLHYLEQVIIALGEKNRTHIPYRNSMMTTVLRDSLGGNCLTAMIATLATCKCNLQESLSTCRFAQRVALVKNEAKLNTYIDNSQLDTIKAEFDTLKYKMTENELRKAVTQALQKLNIKYLKTHEIEECKVFIENFIFNNNNGFTPIIENPQKIKVCFEIFKNVIEDIQKKSIKAEKQAYLMYKRILETRMNNQKDNKYKKPPSTVKILPTRPSTAKGAIYPSSAIKVNSNKSQRVPENNDCNNSKQKQYEGGRISQINRTQSYTHHNCVSNKVFEEKMTNLENIIEECKKAHEKEYDKLSSIQKLMEDNAQSQKSSLTDLNMLRVELMKINKFKCEKESGEDNITYDEENDEENDEEKIIFTYDASKTYVDNDEEFYDEIFTSYQNNIKKNCEQECKTNELYKNGRSKIESSQKGLITSSEPSIHQSKTEKIKFFNGNSIDNVLNVYHHHNTEILSSKPNERKFIKALSLQRIPETKVVLLQKKLLQRSDKTLKSTRVDHQQENNNTYKNVDVSTHYEGNSILTCNGNIYDKCNEEELLKEAQNNAVKSFYDKFGMKTTFKNQNQISSSNKFNNPSVFTNDYEINNCDNEDNKKIIMNYNEDSNDYKNDNSYVRLEKKLELQERKRSVSNFVPIRKQFMHKTDVEKEDNEENADKINIFNFTSDLKSNIAKTLHSSLTTLNMITSRSLDNKSHNQFVRKLDQQANSGFDNAKENLCKTIPLTGDPDIDDEVIAFYKRQNYSIN